MSEELITPNELAATLKITPRCVRRLVAERKIEYVKVQRSVRFEPRAIREYIDRNKVVPMSRAELRRSILEAA